MPQPSGNGIIALEGQTFQTKTGLPFTFRVGPGHIVPIRDGCELNRQIRKAPGGAAREGEVVP